MEDNILTIAKEQANNEAIHKLQLGLVAICEGYSYVVILVALEELHRLFVKQLEEKTNDDN